MHDPTESARKELLETTEQGSREYLTAQYGQTWNTQELQSEFQVLSFLSPFVVAIKRNTQEKGSLQFQHDPRIYHSWQPE